MGYGIWLTILGMLGASNLIIARRPDAASVIARFAPYQGWIGALSALGGLLNTVFAVLGIATLAVAPIWWITWISTSVVQLCLGLLLGVGVIKTFIKDPTANAKMDETIKKLSPFQGTLGLAAIGLGIWEVIASIMFMG
jgi:hypothetical protein